jgi:hypothetical protein
MGPECIDILGDVARAARLRQVADGCCRRTDAEIEEKPGAGVVRELLTPGAVRAQTLEFLPQRLANLVVHSM